MSKKTMSVKEIVFAIIIAVLLAGLDLSILPARLFININVADIEPIYFSLMVNQWLLIIIGLVAVRYLCPNLNLGLSKKNLGIDCKRHLPLALAFLVIAAVAYGVGLIGHYNYQPTVWKVLVETFAYNLSAGFIQELYIRGLLLNILIWLFAKRKNATLIAIILSSVLFSLGHIPDMIGAGFFTMAMRLIWTLMLGIYFGVLYKKTGNLWLPIIAHAIINFSGMAFCFTTHKDFPQISVIIITTASVVLGVMSIYSYKRINKKPATTPRG